MFGENVHGAAQRFKGSAADSRILGEDPIFYAEAPQLLRHPPNDVGGAKTKLGSVTTAAGSGGEAPSVDLPNT